MEWGNLACHKVTIALGFFSRGAEQEHLGGVVLPDLAEDELPLLNFLRDEDAALFIGSGISTWSGLPNWERLLSLLIDRCRALGGRTSNAETALSEQKLTLAADFICEQMTASEIARELRPHLHAPNVRPSSIHKAIAALGVNRFVTTNYDPLLERQMTQQADTRTYLTVTNRNLAELADIQKASADNFIFKIHGDIADAESIVLSDTQYRAIFEDSDNPTRQALETIFLSRPILFLGYSLRDPDLQFILRTLHGRYRGNGGFLWAVMPDLSAEEIGALWRDYRIRAVRYNTKPGLAQNGHADLLRLITALGERHVALSSNSSVIRSSSSLDESVMRYAARNLKRPTERLKVGGYFFHDFQSGRTASELRHLNGRDLSEILQACDEDIVVVGPAGSGKSNSVSEFLFNCADTLLTRLANAQPTQKSEKQKLAIRFDCQAYTGSFQHLLQASVPANLDLGRASDQFQVVLLVDSIDEMPAQYLDDQTWWRDLHGLQASITHPITIYFSRRRDLIPSGELHTLHVEPLSDEVVDGALAEFDLDRKLFSPSFVEQVRTPFLLNLARRMARRGKVPKTPWALLRDFVADCLSKTKGVSDTSALTVALSNLAAATLMLGRETYAYEIFQRHMRDSGVQHETLADELVSVGLLRSEIDRRLRFTHRTLTEFFASRWLQTEWISGRLDLADVLRSFQMDNAVVWASAGMYAERAQELLAAVVDVDASLGVRIAQLAETDRDSIWNAVLPALARCENHSREGWRIADHLDRADVPVAALPNLVLLFDAPNEDISGAAIAKALSYFTDDEVRGVLRDLRSGRFSFNQMNRAGPAIGCRINADLLPDFEEAVAGISPETINAEEKDGGGILHGFREAVENLEEEFVGPMLEWAQRQGDIAQEILVDALWDRAPEHVAKLALGLLARKSKRAVFRVYLWNVHQSPLVPKYSDELCDWLLTGPCRNEDLDADHGDAWSIGLLRSCVDASDEWRQAIRSKERRTADDAALLSVLTPETRQETLRGIFNTVLREGRDPSSLDEGIVRAFDDLESGSFFGEEDILKAIEQFGPKCWRIIEPLWVAPLADEAAMEVTMVDRWISLLQSLDDLDRRNACSLVGRCMDSKGRERLLLRANDAGDVDRDFILQELLMRTPYVTTDALEDATNRRMLELFFENPDQWQTPGAISTERFIEQVVLPFAREKDRDDDFHFALNCLLADAGQRHDRRYTL